MRKLTLLLASTLTLLALYSCDTRRTIYPDGSAVVEISLDWANLAVATDDAQQSPNGATIAFYPQSDEMGEPTFILTNYATATAYLPVGTYDILVFNETIYGHDYIEFSGMDSYETVTAYWESSELSASNVRSSVTRAIVETDDLLLVDKLEDFEITDEMQVKGDVVSLSFTPVLVNRKMTVLAHVNSLHNVSSSGSLLYVYGMAAGYNLSTGLTVNESTTHLTVLNNKTFNEGSTTDGTVSASFYTFGDAQKGVSSKAEDDSNSVALSFKLVDDSTLPDIERDITDEVEAASILEGSTTLDINIELGTGADDDSLIEIPDVEGTGGSTGSGFDAEVSDWGDNVLTNVPI